MGLTVVYIRVRVLEAGLCVRFDPPSFCWPVSWSPAGLETMGGPKKPRPLRHRTPRPFFLNDADRPPTVTPALQRAVHTLEDIAGRSWGSLEDPELGRWSTLVFVRSDCPISNQYAPEIRRIHADYARNGVEFFLVYIDRHLTEETVREHLEEFGHTLPAILDSDHVLVEKAGATITPEVAVFSEGAELEYRGRINNCTRL